MTTRRAWRAWIGGAFAALALACGSDGDNGPVGNTGSIQIAVEPASLSVEQGGTNSVVVSLTRAGGFTGAVSLAITGLPAGVTTTVTPQQLSGATTTATVAVTAAAAVPTGAYTATITATAQGVSQATASYQLNVTAAPDYALAVAPTSLTLAAGSRGSATIAIARTNFTGGVTLALANPPAGITGAFTPSTSTTATAALEVNVAAGVTPGTYTLAIRGSATGIAERTASLDLTVTPNSGSSIAWEFCDAADVPVFFAYQDGDGAWQPVTGSTAEGLTTFTFGIAQGRGGVVAVWRYASSVVADALVVGRADGARRLSTRATALRPGRRARAPRGKGTFNRFAATDLYETFVVFASAAELAEVGRDNCYVAEGTKTITGNVAGVAPGQYGVATLGSATRIFNGAEPVNPLTFTEVPDGPVDFIGTRIVTPGSAPDKLLLVRNLDIPDGGALPLVIDYNATSALTPATAMATMTGGGSDPLEVFTELVTARRTLLMWFDLAPSTNNVRPWAGVPPNAMQSGEYHGVVVFASASARLGENNFRMSTTYVPAVTDQTIAFGPLIDPPSASQVVAGAYPRFRFQGTLATEYHKRITIDLYSAEGEGNAFYMLVTAAWLAASGSALAYDIAMPDVTALAGFPLASRLPQGTNTLSFSASGFTGPGVWSLIPTVGGASKSVIRTVAINVP